MTTATLAHLLENAALDAAAIDARDAARQDMAASIAERVQRAVVAGTLEPATLTDAALDYLAIAQDWECAA